MNTPSPAKYTAAQLAAALGISKQAVLKSLADCPSDDRVIVAGNETPVWTIPALSARLRESLAAKAAAMGLTPFDYLRARVAPWQAPLPLSEISPQTIEAAVKLRAALLPALRRRNSKLLDPAAHTRLGLADYARAFGHTITERHWRRLLLRAEQRDGGAENFERLELYLADQPARKAIATRLLPQENRFADLADSMRTFANPESPTRTEQAAFWSEMFAVYESDAEGKRAANRLRRELLKFLSRHAPWLAENPRALRVAFKRKHRRWQAHGKTAIALLDGREEKRGVPTAEPIPQADKDRLTWEAAANCGGRVAQAVRNLAELGDRSGLSATTLEVITPDAGRKSYVNARLMREVSPDVRNIMPYALGKKAIDDVTAHVQRDYSKLKSMQIVNADDFTMPVYFYVPDGQGWYTLTRGQCLMMVDVRSWRIIGWSLQPERNYSSLTIRTLMNRVCAENGIPEVWYFERGIWKRSHLVKGTAPAGWNHALSASESEVGWQNLGVRFVHATRARSKIVERIGGLMQDLMHGVRGYCGRDERRDCPALTSQAKLDVEFRRVSHPGELFLSFDEWNEELGRLIARYNAASQDGAALPGLSPDEAFENYWPHDNPPARMDANCWHLAANYVRPVRVTVNGISFRIGKKQFVYRNERTGADRGNEVLAWFDPDCPDFLSVTDMNRKNPYLVERATAVDFLAEPNDPALARELGKAAAHSVYPKARFHTLQATFARSYRRNLVDRETAQTAQAMTQQRETAIAEQKQETKVRRAYHQAGMPVPSRGRLDGDAVDDFKRLAELRRKAYETETEEKS